MEFAYRTDIGRRRPNNQDYVGIFKNQSEATLALVAIEVVMLPVKWQYRI